MFYLIHEKKDGNISTEAGIEAKHQWTLPGLKCPVCGSWALTGVQYPEVSLDGFPRIKEMTPWPRSLEEFNDLRANVANWLQADLPIYPGTSFGKLIGKARRQGRPFEFMNPWTLLMSPSTVEKLEDAGVCLPERVSADLLCKKEKVQYVEPSLKLKMHLVGNEVEPCKQCGRTAIKWPDKISVKEADVSEDLVRIHELPTAIICTEKFRVAVAKIGFTDLFFEHIETSQPGRCT